MEEQDRASKTKSLNKSRPLSAFKCTGSPKISAIMRHLFGSFLAARARRMTGNNLRGAGDRLDNENVDLLCAVRLCGEDMDGIE